MFEKEAEEYAEETKTEKELEVLNTAHDWGRESLDPNERRLFEGIEDRKRAREQGFKDGAEFGYNKANEWHYPSKGEYPIDKTEMLVYFKYADYEYPCKTFGFYNGHFWDTKRGDVSNKDVIAWKEIVFPELEENKE